MSSVLKRCMYYLTSINGDDWYTSLLPLSLYASAVLPKVVLTVAVSFFLCGSRPHCTGQTLLRIHCANGIFNGLHLLQTSKITKNDIILSCCHFISLRLRS